MKKIISTERAPKAIGPYSQAVISNGWAFLSGQIPLDPATNQIVEGGIGVQTERVMENLKLVLGGLKLDLSHVIQARVYLTDFKNDYARMNAVYASHFPADRRPARTCVGVTGLARDALVEIDLIARR